MTMNGKTNPRVFTGRHMTWILVAFFGVVMAVNFTMARFALSTFGGTVVDNSYVASQRYNEWLARAAAQDRLGWVQSVNVGEGRHLVLSVKKNGVSLQGLRVSATLNHPLGQAEPRPIHFAPTGDGMLRSAEVVPTGRWRLDVVVRHGGDVARYRNDLQ